MSLVACSPIVCGLRLEMPPKYLTNTSLCKKRGSRPRIGHLTWSSCKLLLHHDMSASSRRGIEHTPRSECPHPNLIRYYFYVICDYAKGATAHPGQSACHFRGRPFLSQLQACLCSKWAQIVMLRNVQRQLWLGNLLKRTLAIAYNCLWVSMISLPKSPSHFPAGFSFFSLTCRRCFYQWKCARTKPPTASSDFSSDTHFLHLFH